MWLLRGNQRDRGPIVYPCALKIISKRRGATKVRGLRRVKAVFPKGCLSVEKTKSSRKRGGVQGKFHRHSFSVLPFLVEHKAELPPLVLKPSQQGAHVARNWSQEILLDSPSYVLDRTSGGTNS